MNEPFLYVFQCLLAIKGNQNRVMKDCFTSAVQTANKCNVTIADLIGKTHLVSALVYTEIMKFNFSKIHVHSPQSTRSSGLASPVMSEILRARVEAMLSASSSSL